MIPKQLEDLEDAMSREDWPQTEALMLDLLKTDGDNASLWYNLGIVRSHTQQYAGAIEAFEHTLGLQPEHPQALYQRAICLLELQNFEDALVGFTAYVEVCPNDEEGLLSLARLALHLEQGELALSALKKREALNNDAENIIGTAEALQMLGQEDGIALLRRIYRKNPGVRSEVLKIMSEGSRGRLPLSLSKLLEQPS